MILRALFPVGLQADCGTVCADAITALTAGIHLDRPLARATGWRGLRPCMGTGYAWTCRTAELPGIYGLAFLEEECSRDALRGHFSLFYFPDPQEAVLASFPTAASACAAAPDYYAFIRDFPLHAESGAFCLGRIWLDLRRDEGGLAFVLNTLTRNRAVSVDGLPLPNPSAATSGQWLTPPDGLAYDVPALRLALPFFRLFAASFSTLLGQEARYHCTPLRAPLPAFDANGDWGVINGAYVPGVMLGATLGLAPPQPQALDHLRPPKKLDARLFRPRCGTEPDPLNRPLLHVVSGFLGSGKTTFISEWLSWLHNHDRYTAVLQNELGAKGLDAGLLADETLTEALDEGCVCCTLADSLRPAIRRMLDAHSAEQIILETTGLANPALVADAVREMQDLVRPGLAVSLVDALTLQAALGSDAATPLTGLALDQVRHAQVLVLNKGDAVPQETLPTLRALLRTLNPAANIIEATHGRIPFGILDTIAEQNKPLIGLPAFGARTHQQEGYSSLLLDVTQPLEGHDIDELADHARPHIVRMKGVVRLRSHDQLIVVQYAASRLSLDPASPKVGEDCFLVLIGQGLNADFIRSLDRFPWLRVV